MAKYTPIIDHRNVFINAGNLSFETIKFTRGSTRVLNVKKICMISMVYSDLDNGKCGDLLTECVLFCDFHGYSSMVIL